MQVVVLNKHHILAVNGRVNKNKNEIESVRLHGVVGVPVGGKWDSNGGPECPLPLANSSKSSYRCRREQYSY